MKQPPPFHLEIDTPALFVDLDVLESNIARMQSFFDGRKARLRPHFKTHKCPPIARRQIAAGAKGITCAKVGEAEVLAAAGICDILVANQIVGEEKIRRLVSLIRQADITVAVDDAGNVEELSAAALAVGAVLGVYVELDIGMGRCGVRTVDEVVRLVRRVSESEGLELRGLQGYEGHLVFAEGGDLKARRVDEALGRLAEAKSALEEAGLSCREVSGGGTGTYRLSGAHPVMTEIQAGSYATMDARYARVADDFEQALFCLVTIISRPEPGLAVGDAGLKSITGEFGLPETHGADGLRVVQLSEEHVAFEAGSPDEPAVGDKVVLVPSHGCTTINLHERLYGVRSGGLECVWPVAARGRFD